MSSSNLNGLSIFRQSEPAQYESDVEAELEVDQLDSDTEPEEQVSSAKPTKSKNGTGRPGERLPGHTLLPATKLENIIQADGGTGTLALSKEGLYVLSIATEEFIKRLIQAGHREASAHRRNQINYTDMAAATRQYQEFMCLADTIPAPLTLAEALELRKRKEKETIEDNPALAVPYPDTSTRPSPEPEHGIVPNPKPPKKSRSTNGNGKETSYGSSSSGAKRSSKRASKAMEVDEGVLEWRAEGPHGAASTPRDAFIYYETDPRNGVSAAYSSIPPPPINGHPSILSPAHSPPYSREESVDPGSVASQSRGEESHSQTPPYDSNWQTPYTGPASGFLQGSAAFGRGSQNPGRTIYSQTHRPD